MSVMDRNSNKSGWSYTNPRREMMNEEKSHTEDSNNNKAQPVHKTSKRVIIKETRIVPKGDPEVHPSQRKIFLIEKTPSISKTPPQATDNEPDQHEFTVSSPDIEDEPSLIASKETAIDRSVSTPEKISDVNYREEEISPKNKLTNGSLRQTSLGETTRPVATRSASDLYNATRASLNTSSSIVIDGGRRYPMLSVDCREKFEPYTRMSLLGLKAIPLSTPEWKVPLMQRKNKQIIEDYLKQRTIERELRENERREKEKYMNIPEWMRPTLKKKEEKKKLEQVRVFEKLKIDSEEQEKFLSYPQWKQELVLRKKQQERIDALPVWQRDLVNKKRVGKVKDSIERRARAFQG